VSQGIELGQHLLGLEAFLVTFGDTQALFVLFETNFDTTPALVVEINISQEGGERGVGSG